MKQQENILNTLSTTTTLIVSVITILASILGSMMWMNGKFNDVDKKFSEAYKELYQLKTDMSFMTNAIDKELHQLKTDMSFMTNAIDKELHQLKTDIAIIKTVMLMRDQYPKELARSSNCVEKTEG